MQMNLVAPIQKPVVNPGHGMQQSLFLSRIDCTCRINQSQRARCSNGCTHAKKSLEVSDSGKAVFRILLLYAFRRWIHQLPFFEG
jgi:hypothetical protein